MKSQPRAQKRPAAAMPLDLTLEQYFAGCAVTGLVAAQLEDPDPAWVAAWSLEFGALMAREARKRRRLTTR